MMSQDERRAAAESILHAEQVRVPMRQLSKTCLHIEIEDAYAIQALWADARIGK